jgi:L-methionine (R)-S-oxide reductase
VKSHDELLREVRDLATSSTDPKTLMQRISDHVHAAMPRYNNILFRVVDDSEPGVLLLGPYTGSFNPYPRLSFGQGLCGTAASEMRTVVVDNVTGDSRYVPGSSMVKSEIAVPILVSGRLAGAIDVQSYFADTFKTAKDRQFLEACAAVVAKHMEQHRKKMTVGSRIGNRAKELNEERSIAG